MKSAYKAAALGAAALSLVGVATLPSISDAQTSQDKPAHHWMHGDHEHGHHGRWGGPRHIEGRIAFLKAELKITSAQEQAFDAVASAMRSNAADAKQAFEGVHQSPPKNALDRLELREKMAEMRAKHLATFVAAFKPLYDGLSDDQRKAADELLAPHFDRG